MGRKWNSQKDFQFPGEEDSSFAIVAVPFWHSPNSVADKFTRGRTPSVARKLKTLGEEDRRQLPFRKVAGK
jgi:hypothetical protein